jgi:hypothetical protein
LFFGLSCVLGISLSVSFLFFTPSPSIIESNVQVLFCARPASRIDSVVWLSCLFHG